MNLEGQVPPERSRRGRKGLVTVITCGAVLLALALFLALRRDQVLFAWYGYRLDWMPEGVLPSMSLHKQLNATGQVAAEMGGRGSERGARWTLSSGELLL